MEEDNKTCSCGDECAAHSEGGECTCTNADCNCADCGKAPAAAGSDTAEESI